MRRASRAVLWSLMLGLIVAGPAPADDLVAPAVDPKLDAILREWEKRSATHQAIGVRFSIRGEHPRWGTTHADGAAFLLRDGRARYDYAEKDDQGRSTSTEHLYWLDRELHQLKTDLRTDYVYPLLDDARGKPSEILALPFLWNLTRDQLIGRYRIALVEETDSLWLLRFEPRESVKKPPFPRAFLALEKATYTPRSYRVVDRDDRSWTHYERTSIRINPPIPEKLFAIPEQNWKTSRIAAGSSGSFLYRLIQKY